MVGFNEVARCLIARCTSRPSRARADIITVFAGPRRYRDRTARGGPTAPPRTSESNIGVAWRSLRTATKDRRIRPGSERLTSAAVPASEGLLCAATGGEVRRRRGLCREAVRRSIRAHFLRLPVVRIERRPGSLAEPTSRQRDVEFVHPPGVPEAAYSIPPSPVETHKWLDR